MNFQHNPSTTNRKKKPNECPPCAQSEASDAETDSTKGGPLHRPPVTCLLLRIFDPPSGHPGLHPPPPQSPAFLHRILGLVRMQLLRPLAGSSTPPQNRLNGIEGSLHPLAVLDVGRRESNGQRDSILVDHQRTLRARFSPIRRIRPSRFAPPAGRHGGRVERHPRPVDFVRLPQTV